MGTIGAFSYNSLEINMEELNRSFENEESAIKFCKEKGMIMNDSMCLCQRKMKEHLKNGKPVWQCPSCSTTYSIYRGSVFQVRFLTVHLYVCYIIDMMLYKYFPTSQKLINVISFIFILVFKCAHHHLAESNLLLLCRHTTVPNPKACRGSGI